MMGKFILGVLLGCYFGWTIIPLALIVVLLFFLFFAAFQLAFLIDWKYDEKATPLQKKIVKYFDDMDDRAIECMEEFIHNTFKKPFERFIEWFAVPIEKYIDKQIGDKK